MTLLSGTVDLRHYSNQQITLVTAELGRAKCYLHNVWIQRVQQSALGPFAPSWFKVNAPHLLSVHPVGVAVRVKPTAAVDDAACAVTVMLYLAVPSFGAVVTGNAGAAPLLR